MEIGKNDTRKTGPALTPGQEKNNGMLKLLGGAAALGIAAAFVMNASQHPEDLKSAPPSSEPPQPKTAAQPPNPGLSTEFYTMKEADYLTDGQGYAKVGLYAGSCVSPFRVSSTGSHPYGTVAVTAVDRGGTMYNGFVPLSKLQPAPQIKGETACIANTLSLN